MGGYICDSEQRMSANCLWAGANVLYKLGRGRFQFAHICYLVCTGNHSGRLNMATARRHS